MTHSKTDRDSQTDRQKDRQTHHTTTNHTDEKPNTEDKFRWKADYSINSECFMLISSVIADMVFNIK